MKTDTLLERVGFLFAYYFIRAIMPGINNPDQDELMRLTYMLRIIFYGLISLLIFSHAAVSNSTVVGDYQPFYDDVDQGLDDPTPQKPVVTQFGTKVLQLCGNWGSRVSPDRFEGELKSPTGMTVLTELRARLDAEGLSYSDSKKGMIPLLKKVWFGANGFRHIFCGEPRTKKLGGLHYRGRYLQMQKKGWGGFDASCHRQQISPPVYTIGLFYQRPDSSKGRSCVKGYSHSLDAEELFIEVTLAYLRIYGKDPENPNIKIKSGKTACRHKVVEDEYQYDAVFVAVPAGIITFYPIVDGTKPNMAICS